MNSCTGISPDEALHQAKIHAQLSVTLAILKSFKFAEWLALIITVLAMAGLLLAQPWPLKLVAFLTIFAGMIVGYFALRIRIDVTLFEQWDSLDMVALDEVLFNINPQHQAGRTVNVRLQGSYRLFRRGLYTLFIQLCWWMVLLWLIKPLQH